MWKAKIGNGFIPREVCRSDCEEFAQSRIGTNQQEARHGQEIQKRQATGVDVYMIQKPKKIKVKSCKNPSCRQNFIPARPLQSVCSHTCALEVAKRKRLKGDAEKARRHRRELREAKERIKGKPELLAEAEKACNAYIRHRDRNKPCISCGEFSQSGYYDAGHYRAKSLQPALRFHEDNIHKQCVKCNQHGHGNLIGYRRGLAEKIGEEKLIRLELDHPLPHWTHEEIRQIRDVYIRLLKKLKSVDS